MSSALTNKDQIMPKEQRDCSTEIVAETPASTPLPEPVEGPEKAEEEPERKKRREGSPTSRHPFVAAISGFFSGLLHSFADGKDVSPETLSATEMKNGEEAVSSLTSDKPPVVEAESTRYFDLLPDAILKEILYKLDVVSKFRLSRVCRKWETFLKKPVMFDQFLIEQTAVEAVEERTQPQTPGRSQMFETDDWRCFRLNDWSKWVWRALAEIPHHLQNAKRVIQKGNSDGRPYVRCASISPMTERSISSSVVMECLRVAGLKMFAHLPQKLYPRRKLELLLQNVNVDFVEFFNDYLGSGINLSNLPLSMKEVVLHLDWKLIDLVVNIGISIPDAEIKFSVEADQQEGDAAAGTTGWGLMDMEEILLDDQEPQDNVRQPVGLMGRFPNELSILIENLGPTMVTRYPDVVVKLLADHLRALSDVEIEKLEEKLAVMFQLGKKGSKINPKVMQAFEKLWPAFEPYAEPMEIKLTDFAKLSRFTQHALVALTDPNVFFDNWRGHEEECKEPGCEHRLLHGSSLELTSTG